MNIAFDLDDVLYDTYMWSYNVLKKHKLLEYRDCLKNYNFRGIPEPHNKMLLNSLYTDDYVKKVPIKNQCADFIKTLRKKHNIYIVTARGDDIMLSTRARVLGDFGIDYKHVFNAKNKTELCNRLNIDIVVDDNPFFYDISNLNGKLLVLRDDKTMNFYINKNIKVIKKITEVERYASIS